jgi:rSAM/selenodomain-associated transferase 1
MKRLALFAKRPVPDRAKTRLSPALPADLACDLYRAMLADAQEAAALADADERYIYWAEEPHGDPGPGGSPFKNRVQHEGDLGVRLERAFAELLRADEERAVILGADCPELDSAMLSSAFAALDSRDLVLGPTRDGGYYLVGLRRSAPEIFRGIAWSTGRVLEQTLERARDAGLTHTVLAELEDLDTAEDLVRWIGRAAAGRVAGHHTQEALREMALLPPAAGC